MAFNPKEYWQNRENPNAIGHSVAPRFIYNFISEHLGGAKKILEVGPGVGRLLNIYDPGHEITTIDLSSRYKKEIANRAKELGLSIRQKFLGTPEDPLPFPVNAFDLGVSVQVFMHVPEEYIESTIAEFVRVCRRVIFVSSLDVGRGNHVFTHDYHSIIGSTPGISLRDFKKVGNTGCFAVIKD